MLFHGRGAVFEIFIWIQLIQSMFGHLLSHRNPSLFVLVTEIESTPELKRERHCQGKNTFWGPCSLGLSQNNVRMEECYFAYGTAPMGVITFPWFLWHTELSSPKDANAISDQSFQHTGHYYQLWIEFGLIVEQKMAEKEHCSSWKEPFLFNRKKNVRIISNDLYP